MAIQKRKTRMYEPWGYREENEYQSSAGMLSDDLEKFFARVEYNKDDEMLYFYNKDDEQKGSVDVSEFAASVIDDVYYDSTTKILTIKFSNGKVIEVNLAELIDENEFGDGLVVNDGIVSVLLDPQSEGWITVSDGGIKISGIQAELDKLEAEIQSGGTSAITEIKEEIVKINSAITEINNEVSDLNSAITEANSAITEIEGEVDDINSALTETNSAITEIEDEVDGINSALTEINSAMAEFEENIKDVNSAITSLEDGVKEINSAITEINETLADHESDISNLYSAFTEVNSDITSIEGEIDGIYSAITNINSALTDTITDIKVNDEGNLDLMNYDELLDTVPLTDAYYTKQDISVKEHVISAALNELNDKIGEQYTKEEIDNIIEKDEEITAAALNDINDRKVDSVEYQKSNSTLKFYATNEDGRTEVSSVKLDINMDDYYTKTEIDEDISSINSSISSINSSKFDNASYVTGTTNGETYQRIEFYANGSTVATIDAKPFIKDGMVNNVEIKDVTIGGESVTCLVITFNTDAGKQEIDIELSDIFDSKQYYKKSEVDEKIAALSGDVEDNELVISSSLNDLNARILNMIQLVKLTQSEYDALVNSGTVDENTLYIITN